MAELPFFSFNGSGEGDELFVTRSVKQKSVTENLYDSRTGFAGKLRSNSLTISQASFLDSDFYKFVCIKGFVSGFDNFFAEMLLADHDEWAQTMAMATQKTILFAGQLECYG
jgi:hypothetical protein